jgi:hypothetical protein
MQMTEQTREIFVVMGLSVDGDRVVTYGAYTSMDAAQIKRQFVMSDFGKEVWVNQTLLQTKE